MKPNKEQLATLNDIEHWARKLQKETESKIRVIDNMFNKELQKRSSNIADVKYCLHTEVDDAMYELIGYIQSAKIELDY